MQNLTPWKPSKDNDDTSSLHFSKSFKTPKMGNATYQKKNVQAEDKPVQAEDKP